MNWKEFIQQESAKPYYQSLKDFIAEDAKNHIIYPPREYIFQAFELTPLDKIKVVILAQDPYINPNQAHGLAFSVLPGNPAPPSLKNIFKEIKSDLNSNVEPNVCLNAWAEQGVFLLNSTLTVRAGASNSHKGRGWEQFSDNAIKLINQQDQPIVYLLWGASAKSKKALITNPNHTYFESVHPSPLSASQGFFGCKHFSKANDFLTQHQLSPINWI